MQGDGCQDCLFKRRKLNSVIGEVWTEHKVGVSMCAPHQVANALKEGQPYARILQSAENRHEGTPLAQVVLPQVDEVEAPGTLDKASGLKQMGRARKGSQAGKPGDLRQT